MFSLILLELTCVPAVYRGFITLFRCSDSKFVCYLHENGVALLEDWGSGDVDRNTKNGAV